MMPKAVAVDRTREHDTSAHPNGDRRRWPVTVRPVRMGA